MISATILKRHHLRSEDDLYNAYKIFFGTLVSASRLRIINLLRDGKKNVSELMQTLAADQTAVSHDLSRLKHCGFVCVTTEGKYRYYSLNEATIKPLMKLIDVHMTTYCVHILHTRDKKHHHYLHI